MKTFKLKMPIEFGDEIVNEIKLRKAQARDLRCLGTFKDLQDLGFKQILDLIASMSNQPPAVIDRMDLSDINPIMEEVLKTLEAGLGTGETA